MALAYPVAPDGVAAYLEAIHLGTAIDKALNSVAAAAQLPEQPWSCIAQALPADVRCTVPSTKASEADPTVQGMAAAWRAQRSFWWQRGLPRA